MWQQDQEAEPGMVARTVNPSTREDSIRGISMSSRPARSAERVPEQPRLHSEPSSQKQTKRMIGKKQRGVNAGVRVASPFPLLIQPQNPAHVMLTFG